MNATAANMLRAPPPAAAVLPQLHAETLPIASLDARVRRAMFALYATYYDATDPLLFNADLDAKQQVVLMWDEENKLRGFTGLATLRMPDAFGQTVRAIYSGDTIVDHRYWGQQTLAFHWIRLAGRVARQEPAVPLYWFLIVKGHRTYRYLHAFTRRYYPHWRDPTPPREQALMHRLGGWRFPRHYDSASGLIRFPRSRGQLSAAWARVDANARARPEVDYFLTRNPNYANGDELVCLTRLESTNLKPLARRLFQQTDEQ